MLNQSNNNFVINIKSNIGDNDDNDYDDNS